MDNHDDKAEEDDALRALDIVRAGDLLLEQPCVQFGLPDEAAYAGEVIDRLRAVVDQVSEAFVPSAGLGLAAPQVGIARTAAIVRLKGGPELVLLNPRITEASVEETSEYEGCLSMFEVRGLVPRPKVIEVVHQSFDGQLCTSRFRGATARLVAHEADHLLGVMYTARMPAGTEPIPLNELPDLGPPRPGGRW